MIYLRRVVGGSMRPTLKPGRLILCVTKKPKIGDVVICSVDGRQVVKRIVYLGDFDCNLSGDNAASAHYKNVSLDDIKAVVFWPKVTASIGKQKQFDL